LFSLDGEDLSVTDDELIARAVTFLRWTESQRSEEEDFQSMTVDSMPLRRIDGSTIRFEREGSRAHIEVVIDRLSGKVDEANYYLPPPEATPTI
jgi:hypothetical protein